MDAKGCSTLGKSLDNDVGHQIFVGRIDSRVLGAFGVVGSVAEVQVDVPDQRRRAHAQELDAVGALEEGGAVVVIGEVAVAFARAQQHPFIAIDLC